MITTRQRRQAIDLARATAVALGALGAAGALAAVTGACDPPTHRKPIEMAPIGTVPEMTRTADEPDGGTTTTPNSGTPMPGRELTPCAGDELDPLEDALRQCEVKMPRAGEVPTGLRDKLEVRVTSATPTIPPAGRVELTLALKNKSSEPLPLYFTGDPGPRFEIEAFDAKGRRVDLPPGRPPKGLSAPARATKAMRVTLGPGGTARAKIPWDAVKMRWAPDKAKGWDGSGYPRTASAPLPAGKYTLRVVVPLIGGFGKGELETPKVTIDVGL